MDFKISINKKKCIHAIILALCIVCFLFIQYVLGNTPRLKYLAVEMLVMLYMYLLCVYKIFFVADNKNKLKKPHFQASSTTITNSLIYIVILLLIILFVFWINPGKSIYECSYDNANPVTQSKPIYEDITIEQHFDAIAPFNCISIDVGNNGIYKIKDKYYFDIELFDRENNRIKKWEIDRDTIDETTSVELDLDRVYFKNSYLIVVSAPKLSDEYPIVVWLNDAKNVSFSLKTKHKNYFTIITLIIFVITALLWCMSKESPFEYQAFILIFGLGLCYIVMMSPFSVPDETAHFSMSYKISNIILGNDPDSIEKIHSFNEYTTHFISAKSYIRVLNELTGQNTYAEQSLDVGVNDLAFPLPYLLSGIIISVFRILKQNFLWIYYGGRIINLLLFSFISMHAIRLTPKFKYVILFISLSPIVLQQAGSFSYDSLIICSSFLYFAILNNCIYEKESISLNDMFSIFLVSLCFIPTKLIYIIMLIFFFLIPSEKFKSSKFRWITWCIIFIANILMTIFVMKGSLDMRSIARPENHYSMTYFFCNPLKCIQFILNNIYTKWWDWTSQIFGHWLSGFCIEITGEIYIIIMLLILAVCIQHENDYPALNVKQKIILCIGIILVIGLAVFSMFLLTRRADDVITGVQGRYFLPIVFSAAMVINSNKVHRKYSDSSLLYVYVAIHILVINAISVGFLT